MSQKNLSSEGGRGGGGGGVAGQQGAGGKGREGSVNGKGVSSPSASLSLSHSLFLAQISLHCDYPVQFCNSYASLPHLVVWPCKGLLVGMETGTVLVPIVRDTKLHSL